MVENETQSSAENTKAAHGAINWNDQPFVPVLPVKRIIHIVRLRDIPPDQRLAYVQRGCPPENILLCEFELELISPDITLAIFTNAPEAECELPDRIYTPTRDMGSHYKSTLFFHGRKERGMVSARLSLYAVVKNIKGIKGARLPMPPVKDVQTPPPAQPADSPAPPPVSDNAVAMALRLAQELDANPKIKSPNHLTVLRLYCLEEMTIQEIEKTCKCSHGTVINRKRILEKKLRGDLDSFKHHSGVFQQMLNTLQSVQSQGGYNHKNAPS